MCIQFLKLSIVVKVQVFMCYEHPLLVEQHVGVKPTNKSILVFLCVNFLKWNVMELINLRKANQICEIK